MDNGLYLPLPENKILVQVPGKQMQRMVVSSANRLDDGLIIAGVRHWDTIMRRIAERIGWDDCRLAEQGFIDQWGNFMTREEAAEVAIASGQIEKLKFSKTELFSEDLYSLEVYKEVKLLKERLLNLSRELEWLKGIYPNHPDIPENVRGIED